MSIRDEVRASTAAYRDLGPGYDTAVAEGLVERIGEEIDKRVDARLYGQAPYQSPSRGRGCVVSLGPDESGSAPWCWASVPWAWPSGPRRRSFTRATPPARSAGARRC